MNLDIRFPLGWIFLVLGMVLTGFGSSTRGSAMYAISMGANLKLIWGALMLVFGIVMLLLARRPLADDLVLTRKPSSKDTGRNLTELLGGRDKGRAGGPRTTG
jgi:hypothetical protein